MTLDLGLEVNCSVDRDHEGEAAKLAKKWDGKGNVLVCWEHQCLGKIAEKIGAEVWF